ncbi:unnamed protein product, partial [Tilletia caries]
HPSQSQRAPLAAQVVSKNPAAGSSSVAAGSTSAAAPRDSSKRIRKPNSRFSDYEQDEPSRLRKRSSGTAAATAVNLATANYSDDSLADGNYNDKDVDDEDEFSEEDNIFASDLSPAKSKGKKKASAPAPAVKKAKPPRKNEPPRAKGIQQRPSRTRWFR